MNAALGHLIFHFGFVVLELFTGVLLALLVHDAIRRRGRR